MSEQTTASDSVKIRRGWRTPAALYRLISHPALRAVLGWDFPRRDVHWVKAKPGATYVEIGSGGGFYTEALARHLGPSSTLIGLDPATSAQLKLSQKLSGVPGARLACIAGDGCKLPFADNSVDALFYGYSLEEVPDPLEAVTEAERVLRPGGQLVIFLWRPVIMARRRAPVLAFLDRKFARETIRRGPQNLRLAYRKP